MWASNSFGGPLRSPRGDRGQMPRWLLVEVLAEVLPVRHRQGRRTQRLLGRLADGCGQIADQQIAARAGDLHVESVSSELKVSISRASAMAANSECNSAVARSSANPAASAAEARSSATRTSVRSAIRSSKASGAVGRFGRARRLGMVRSRARPGPVPEVIRPWFAAPAWLRGRPTD